MKLKARLEFVLTVEGSGAELERYRDLGIAQRESEEGRSASFALSMDVVAELVARVVG